MNVLERNIESILKDKNHSYKWLAEQVGYSRQGLKSGISKKTIKYESIEKIAQVLGVNVEILTIEQEWPDARDEYTFIENWEFVFIDILSKRCEGFYDMISFLQDYYVRFILRDIEFGYRPSIKVNETRVSLLTDGQYEIIKTYTVFSMTKDAPFSKWKTEYKNQIYESKLFYGFYFPLFERNHLNICNYMEDGMIQDNEILKFYKDWKKGIVS